MTVRHRALVVVDYQLDFCPGGALAVEGGDDIAPLINGLLAQYPVRVLTQDWHPADHLSFASQHLGAHEYATIEAPYGPQVLWPDHCVQGSEGADFHPALHADRADLVIRKGFRRDIDSYSAFFENDRTTPTGLAGYLRERGVDSVDFAGLALDFCVAWSALDAAKLGFKATIHAAACRAIDLDGSLAAARADLAAAGVTVREG